MRAPIGFRISNRRKSLKISQAGLARLIGISPSYLNLIENNKRDVGGTLLQRVALHLGIPDATIQSGFASFGGVKRRFTKVGEIMVDGGVATIIDDYGHHPVEIRAVLAAAREGARSRVVAVVQPHRFTRLRDLMDDFQQAFNDADIVYVTPVYTAGEQPIEGIDADALVAGLKRRGHRAAQTIADADALAAALAADLKADDMIVCLGAGDITKWAAGLADAIRSERAE